MGVELQYGGAGIELISDLSVSLSSYLLSELTVMVSAHPTVTRVELTAGDSRFMDDTAPFEFTSADGFSLSPGFNQLVLIGFDVNGAAIQSATLAFIILIDDTVNIDPPPTDDPPVEEPTLRVTELLLKDRDSGTTLATLSDGETINLGDYPGSMVIFEANLAGTPGSVQFFSNGELRVTENQAPWQDRLSRYPSGTNRLVVLPKTEPAGAGLSGEALELTLEVIRPDESGVPGTISSGYTDIISIAKNTESLCDYLAAQNAAYVDRESFAVTVGDVAYPVINAHQRFDVTPNAGDQRSRIQTALDQVDRSAGDGVALPSGFVRGPTVLFFPRVNGASNYLYSDVLSTNSSEVAYCGTGVTLEATVAERTSWQIRGQSVHAHGFFLKRPDAAISSWPERWPGEGTTTGKFGGDGKVDSVGASVGSSFVLSGARDVVVSGTHSIGGARGGFRLYSAEDVLLYDNRVERTHSDSIHVVQGSRNVTVLNNTIIDSGDDCISVVAYNNVGGNREGRASPENVYVEGNECYAGRTRGLTVIGGYNVTFKNNYVENMLEPGVLIFPTHQHTDKGAADITVEGNMVVRANRGQRVPYSGGISLMSGNQPENALDNILVRDNTVTDTYAETANAQLFVKHSNTCCVGGSQISFVDNVSSGSLRALRLDGGFSYQAGNMHNGASISAEGTNENATGASYRGVRPGRLGVGSPQ